MNNLAPCKDCPKRYVKELGNRVITCHEKCNDYKEFVRVKRIETELEKLERFKNKVTYTQYINKKGKFHVQSKRHSNYQE